MKKTVNYRGAILEVRGGAWCDIMNECLYQVIDTIDGYAICVERRYDTNGKIIGDFFALPTF